MFFQGCSTNRRFAEIPNSSNVVKKERSFENLSSQSPWLLRGCWSGALHHPPNLYSSIRQEPPRSGDDHSSDPKAEWSCYQLRLVVYPIIYRVSYIPGGARFQPSTVVKIWFIIPMETTTSWWFQPTCQIGSFPQVGRSENKKYLSYHHLDTSKELLQHILPNWTAGKTSSSSQPTFGVGCPVSPSQP